jgi:preprotein translocase subunit YajC
MTPIPPFWSILAFQDAAQPPGWLSFAPMLIILVIFYLLLFAPMRKRQKALAQMIDNLKKGDRVVTNGGIYGEIQGLDANTVTLKIADNVRIKLAKSAIAGLEKEGDTP